MQIKIRTSKAYYYLQTFSNFVLNLTYSARITFHFEVSQYSALYDIQEYLLRDGSTIQIPVEYSIITLMVL